MARDMDNVVQKSCIIFVSITRYLARGLRKQIRAIISRYLKQYYFVNPQDSLRPIPMAKDSAAQLHIFFVNSASVRGVAFSPDNKFIAVASSDFMAVLWAFPPRDG